MKKLTAYFTKTELTLWGGSTILILLSFVIFDRENYMTLAASLIGAASLILSAKGNPIGQVLMILFSLFYGVISYSFAAVYLTFRRSPFFALAYAANDVVLIVLWVLAALEDATYLSVTICFMMFLVNDLYGFVSWRKMEKRQLETG